MDKSNVDLLKKTYQSVDDVDLYVRLLLERINDPTALLGPTGTHLIADQFNAFKRGDRFYFENTEHAGALTQAEYEAIRNYSLAQLICENTSGLEMVQGDIFQFNSVKKQCSSFRPFPLEQILSSRALSEQVDHRETSENTRSLVATNRGRRRLQSAFGTYLNAQD
ncbi:hypothetical protein PRIPAC_76507 [Pristionchus pacificus]|uniref:Peroxidase n=1 Tax=Pristionchus pacificus TaxID=54126 RepID=A0A2A6CG03_PRIPA|nr:hypothetical protein PRIPAC_76507 [Pristionchus pacificus]|eukprot:PDM77144.1 peroxidase [Pristionchus pacificus]